MSIVPPLTHHIAASLFLVTVEDVMVAFEEVPETIRPWSLFAVNVQLVKLHRAK